VTTKVVKPKPDPTDVVTTPSGIEEWRPVPGFPGYEVSTEGRIRSYLRLSTPGGEPRLLKQQLASNGYLSVILAGPGNYRSKKKFVVHRIVLSAFDRAPKDGEEADHLNGDRSDNRLGNLQWVTRRENHLRRTKRAGKMRTLSCPCCSASLYLAQGHMELAIDTRVA
jgi:hypothetical protein